MTLEKRQDQAHLNCAWWEGNFHDTSSRTEIVFQLCQAQCQKDEICILMALRLVLWSVIFWSHCT